MRHSPAALPALATLVLAMVPALAQDPPREAPPPDPASVARCGPAFRHPQDGWIVLHVEGAPHERGFQHGRLLAEEIVAYAKACAAHRARRSPEDGWATLRTLTDALFLRGFDQEQLAEMRGIADGCTAAGATLFGKPFDLLDVATLNASIELLFVEDGLAALPQGLEGQRFETPSYQRPGRRSEGHCSAFAATGPATRDGKIVFGHITMFNLEFAHHFKVWCDLKPKDGHRLVYQTAAGVLWSGLDWYQNDAGILLCETTIGQTAFERGGKPLVSRARRAMQYCDTIDGVVAELAKENNGLYSNEWLIADTKTDEIALFELGTKRSKLLRSSRDEWYHGTKGFYFGCNNERDLEVRLEQVPSLVERPRDLTWVPSDRDIAWQRLWDQHHGKIDLAFGKLAFTTPPLAASHSLDAKVTDSRLAASLSCLAVYGSPLGRTWHPDPKQAAFGLPSLAPNDWTLLRPREVEAAARPACDLEPFAKEDRFELPVAGTPAWRGTPLPGTGADLWLSPALAAHERWVATELLVPEPQRDAAAARLAFRERARWHFAVRQAGGTDIPLAKLEPDSKSQAWHSIAAGKGALVLEGLRQELGTERYLAAMDRLGIASAGKTVTTAALADALGAAGLADAATKLAAATAQPRDLGPAAWSVLAFEQEPDRAWIVYATDKESELHREAAEALQRCIAARWANTLVPIHTDRELDDEHLAGHHVVFVGRPEASARLRTLLERADFPVRFGRASFTLGERTYAHPDTAVIAAAANPADPRYSLVLYAGLSSAATRRCVEAEAPDCEVHLLPRGY